MMMTMTTTTTEVSSAGPRWRYGTSCSANKNCMTDVRPFWRCMTLLTLHAVLAQNLSALHVDLLALHDLVGALLSRRRGWSVECMCACACVFACACLKSCPRSPQKHQERRKAANIDPKAARDRQHRSQELPRTACRCPRADQDRQE